MKNLRNSDEPYFDLENIKAEDWPPLILISRFRLNRIYHLSTIYDACPIGFSIFKDEEVVSQHVHLQDCFFAVHWFQWQTFRWTICSVVPFSSSVASLLNKTIASESGNAVSEIYDWFSFWTCGFGVPTCRPPSRYLRKIWWSFFCPQYQKSMAMESLLQP